MNNLQEESIAALNNYLNYVSTQQNQLESMEKKKEEYANSFFNNNKEMAIT